MQTDAGLANLANVVALPTDEFDALLFAKTHFTQANGHFRRSGQLFDTNRSANCDATQWTQQRLGAIAGGWNRITHVARKL